MTVSGVSNEPILKNLTWLSEKTEVPYVIRCPILKEINDSFENIDEMCNFLKTNLSRCETIELLPYHSLGVSKSMTLELDNIFKSEKPSDEHLQALKDRIESYGYRCILR